MYPKKENFAQQNFESITCVKKNLCQKNFWVQTNLGQTKFWAKKYFGQNNILVKKIGCPKILIEKVLSKLGQKQLRYSCMDKCRQDKCCLDKCCLDKCHRDNWHLLKMVPKTYI